jgi:uncharacterized protein (TIGR02265 family)
MMLLESYDASRAIDFLSPHCDLVERLQAVPPSARIRGVWFQIFLNELRERNLLHRYEEYFPNERWTALQFYWVGDYLVRIALAGAVLAGSADRLHDGMFELNRCNAKRFADTLLGRTLFRLLSNDPRRLLQQGMASRRQTMNYGRWLVSFPTPNQAHVTFEEEYIWIDPNLVGATTGTFDAVNMPVLVTATIDSKFNGSIRADW